VRIVLFSASTKVKNAFEAAAKGETSLEIHAPPALANALGKLQGGCLVYVDVSKLEEAEIVKVGRALGKAGLPHGFVDPGDGIKDVALLFQSGASDFIGGTLLKKGIDPARFKRAAEAFSASGRSSGGISALPTAKTRTTRSKKARAAAKLSERKSTGSPADSAGRSRETAPPASSWGEIEEEREYLFCLMYIEMDNLAELRKSLGEKNILLTVKTFKEWVERSIASYDGKLWMWKEFNGLALFPFDGSRCGAVVPCLRLMLAKRIFSADLPFLGTALSYRIALHIGSTVYRRKGDTGEIVSDALNSVFHLGRKFLEPGNFTITQSVYACIPDCLKDCFIEAGTFEGSAVMRMRLPR
jgi:hypothetical protein